MLIQKRKAQDNNIHFHASYEDVEDMVIVTDKQRVMQVLLCLQSNALKFTQGGEVHTVVKVTNNTLEVQVRDTGVGISKENQKKLF